LTGWNSVINLFWSDFVGTVFRRSFWDKKTGKAKRVRCYSIKYRDAQGQWVTEPTEAVQKHIAQRVLRERESQVQQQLIAAPPQAGVERATRTLRPSTSESPNETVLLADLRDRFPPSIRVRLKQTTVKMYGESLHFVLPRLGGVHGARADSRAC
jgi:hypothetical protein